MRYDPEDHELYFNKEMILSDASSAENSEHFRAYQHEVLNHPIKWFGDTIKDPDGETTGKTIAGAISGIVLFGGILAALICLSVKLYDVIPWILCVAIGLISAFIFLFPVGEGNKVFAESKLAQRIQGAIGVLCALGLIVITITVPSDDKARYIMIIVLELCISLFLTMLVKTIAILNAPKSIYREEVHAECIGYVRTFESQSDGSGGSYYPVYSPVYEYHYNGQKYQSYCDVWFRGKDGTVPVGSSCEIRIDPENPARVMGNCGYYAITPAVFAIMTFIASIVLLVLLLK